jgi:wyosine [tRNA(Phe)-imidazoG37] synthetase (radical SAM superfamily)
MPKCLMFKHGMTIGPVGNVRPCCMYMNEDIDQRYNEPGWREKFDELYDASLDKWLPNCYECKAEEDRGQTSLRQQANEWFEGAQGIQYWDLKLHNTCNLTCVMCNPISSSKWQTLVNDNPEEEWLGVVKKEARMRTGWHKDILPEMMEQLYDTKYLKFTGGEPLLIPHVKKIIKKLYEDEVSPAVRLSIITNGTVPIEPEFLKMLLTFKQVIFLVSIDGIEDRFEYIRQGAKWSDVEYNLKQFKQIEVNNSNFNLNINYLPMAVNAAQDNDAEAWAKENKITFSKSVEIYRPKYLTYASLSYKLRERYGITSNYEYDEAQYKELLKHMAIKDKLLGTDFKSACPEFFEDE